MPSKSFFAKLVALIFLLASTPSVYVQAAIIPALGDKGIRTPAIGDIQRSSIADCCGDLDITQNLDTPTAVTASACEAFSPSINLGVDGSQSIETVQVCASKIGKNFVIAKIVVDSDLIDEATNVRSRPVEDDKKTKGKCGRGDKLQGVKADKRQGETYSQGKRTDKRQSYGTVGQSHNYQGGLGPGQKS